MKTKVYFPHQMSVFIKLLLLAALLFSLAAQPTRAASPAIIVTGHITESITWTQAESPYQVYSEVIVDPDVTLTIEPGVTVENYSNGGVSQNYNFTVEGTLIANGAMFEPIYFNPGPEGWSGINIIGQPGDINTGSSLSFVVLEGGGFGGSGVGANLRLQYAVVDVHNCEFNHSPGDGILGDDAGAQGSANIYVSSFTGNAGYAVNFQDGSVNPILFSLTAIDNGATLPYGGNMVVVNDATLHGNHTWEYMALPYLILQTNVGPDGVLTIEPGVHVLVQPGNNGLDVQGRLIADAAAGQIIHFDPADPASAWSGISIVGTDIQPSTGNVLNNVSITRGGIDGYCDLYVSYGDVSVTNSQLDGGQDSGVCLDFGAGLNMTDTLLTNNQEYAMDVIDANARFTLDNLTASGNMSDTIGIEGGTIMGIHTWSKSGINTYDLHYNYLTIAPTGTLTIEPGVTVLFGETRDITVKGTLTALGTPTDPITFTGETPIPGLWGGLTFEGTPEQHAVGRFAYTTIEYGGYAGSTMVSIQNADVSFTHCILRYSAGDAIEIWPDESLALLPVNPLASQPVRVNWSSLYGISSYAIQNLSDQTALAAYNWWGSASGPTADDNPGGTGSAITGLVQYRPYLTAPGIMSVFLPLATK